MKLLALTIVALVIFGCSSDSITTSYENWHCNYSGKDYIDKESFMKLCEDNFSSSSFSQTYYPYEIPSSSSISSSASASHPIPHVPKVSSSSSSCFMFRDTVHSCLYESQALFDLVDRECTLNGGSYSRCFQSIFSWMCPQNHATGCNCPNKCE